MAKQPANGRKTPAKSTKATGTDAERAESVAVVGPQVDPIPPEVHAKAVTVPAETPSVPVTEKPKPTPPATQKAAPAPAQSSGFLPLVLGGLLAGVMGFAVATFTAPAADNTLAGQLAEQAAAISSLEQQVATIPSTDLTGIVADQDALTSEVTALQAALADISERLAALEALPPAPAASSGVAAGVADEMDALRAQIAEMTDAAQIELEEARAAADSIEANAAAAARSAAARAALARVQTALESGAPIGAALGDLEEAIGASAPDALLAVQDGVPTLGSLQEQFPDVARAALAIARSEGVSGEETTGFGAFLRNQFDVRSTTPREGNSADAVLSRAEAAMRGGRLADALSEISALPEVARAEMSDWLAQAEARADAIAAVDILSSSISGN